MPANLQMIPPEIQSDTLSSERETIKHARGLSGLVKAFLSNYFAAHKGELPTPGLYDRVMKEVEKPLYQETLKAVSGNQKKAAYVLGINRNTLRKKLSDLGIDINTL